MQPPTLELPSGPDGRGGAFHLHDVLSLLRRNRWLVAGVTVLAVGLAGLLTWMQKPVFMSETTIRIDESQSSRMLTEINPFVGNRPRIETEIAVLRSRSIAEDVVDSLSLHVQVVSPHVTRGRVFSRVDAPRDVVPGLYVLRPAAGGAYTVQAQKDGRGTGAPARVVPGRPFRLGNVELTLSPAIRREVPGEVTFGVFPFRNVVSGVRGGTNVVRPELNAQIVSVSYRSTDSTLAAAVPNVVTAAFIKHKARASKGESSSRVDFLREQVGNYEGQLQEAETRLRTFREQQRVVSPQDQASEQIKRLATLQGEREELESQRTVLLGLLQRAESRPGGADYRELASFKSMGAMAMQEMLASLTELENQRAQELLGRTPESDRVQTLERRISEVQAQLGNAARAQLQGLETQIANLDRTLSQFGAELELIPSREIELARLLRQHKLLEELSTLLQTSLKEAEIQEAVEPGDVRVVDAALVPEWPVAPRPTRNLVLGMILGLMLGLGAAFAREALDTKVRTREDAEVATEGITVLGAIPRISMAVGGRNGRKEAAAASRLAEALPTNRLVTRYDSSSPVSEAYRALRTSITFASASGIPQVIVFTSALPGDGKTTSSSNLAVSLAQQGVKTLLVDGDLRRGLLHEILDGGKEPGLTHLLATRTTTLDEAVQVIELPGSPQPLYFLSSGAYPPHPAELLGSDRMKALIGEMRSRFEVVVIDAPPLNLVTDGAILGTVADATILVARAGVTDRRALQHAAGQLRQLRAHVAGVVLNDLRVEELGTYYGYGYGYGYGYKYAYGAPESNGSNGRNGKH